MAKCPECGEEISELINVCSAWKLYRYTPDGNYEHIDDVAGDTSEYECPECNEVLFYSEEEAKEFLSKTSETEAENSQEQTIKTSWVNGQTN